MLCFLSIFNAVSFPSEANLGLISLHLQHLHRLCTGLTTWDRSRVANFLSMRKRCIHGYREDGGCCLFEENFWRWHCRRREDAPWKNDKSIFDILFYYQSSLVKIIFPPLCLTFHHDLLSFAWKFLNEISQISKLFRVNCSDNSLIL